MAFYDFIGLFKRAKKKIREFFVKHFTKKDTPPQGARYPSKTVCQRMLGNLIQKSREKRATTAKESGLERDPQINSFTVWRPMWTEAQKMSPYSIKAPTTKATGKK